MVQWLRTSGTIVYDDVLNERMVCNHALRASVNDKVTRKRGLEKLRYLLNRLAEFV